MTGEIPEPSSFLIEHRREVADWAAIILEHFDRAESTKDNNGSLHVPGQQAHCLNASWEAPGSTLEKLPESLKAQITYPPDHPLRFDISLADGSKVRSQSLVMVDTADPEAPIYEFSHHVHTANEQLINPLPLWHPNYWNMPNMSRYEIQTLMGIIFAQNSNYQDTLADSGFFAACQTAALTQASFTPTEVTTRDHANKVYDVVSSDGQPISAGFNLSVKIDDRHHPNGKPSHTTLTLNRHVDHHRYGLGPYATVTLNQRLFFDQSPSGEIIKIGNDAGIDLEVRGLKSSQPVDSSLTRHCLSPEPTMEDLVFFERLITAPIEPTDLAIQ